MKTVREAIAEGYDQLVIYRREPTRHGTERIQLGGVNIETELDVWPSTFAKDSGHQMVTGASITRSAKN